MYSLFEIECIESGSRIHYPIKRKRGSEKTTCRPSENLDHSSARLSASLCIGPLGRTNDGRIIIFWRRGEGDYSGGGSAGLMKTKPRRLLVCWTAWATQTMPTKPTVYNCHQFNQIVIRFGHLLALILKRATRLCRRWIIFISVYMVYDSSHKFWTTKATKWQFAKKNNWLIETSPWKAGNFLPAAFL